MKDIYGIEGATSSSFQMTYSTFLDHVECEKPKVQPATVNDPEEAKSLVAWLPKALCERCSLQSTSIFSFASFQVKISTRKVNLEDISKLTELERESVHVPPRKPIRKSPEQPPKQSLKGCTHPIRNSIIQLAASSRDELPQPPITRVPPNWVTADHSGRSWAPSEIECHAQRSRPV